MRKKLKSRKWIPSHKSSFQILKTSGTSVEHVITFKKSDVVDVRLDEEYKIQMFCRIDAAFDFVTENLTNKVGTLGPNTNALPRRAIKEISDSMRINFGDTIWEIGCGCPKAAFAFSAAACGGFVLATDTCSYFLNLLLA